MPEYTDEQCIDWLEQRHWDAEELHRLIDGWRWQERRYPAGLREAISAAMHSENVPIKEKTE